MDRRKRKVVGLRFFGCLSLDEIAGILRASTKTVDRDLAFAEAWLRQQMRETWHL